MPRHRAPGRPDAAAPAAPAHHDGSALYVPEGTPSLGDTVPVRVRVPRGTGVRDVWLRTVRDGEPRMAPARLDRSDEHEDWYVADVLVHNPVTRYRFFLDVPGPDGRSGYRWLNGRGTWDRDVPDAADFRLTVHDPAPAWLSDGVVYQVFPDRFARSAAAGARPLPSWAVPAAWDDEPHGSGPDVGVQYYGGDLAGIEERLDHLVALGVSTLYTTPVFPGRSNHRYDAATFDRVDPLLGGDEAYASLIRAAHARGLRVMGDLTTNHTGSGHEWFARARADEHAPEHDFYYWTDDEPGYVGWLEHASLPKLSYGSRELAARMIAGPDSVVGRYLREPFGLDGWRIDVANMTGRYGAEDRTHEIARTLRATMRAIDPDAGLVAEHFHDASDDLAGDGWHANMNYSAFTRPVWTWLSPEDSAVPYLGLPVRTPRRGGRSVVETMREFDAAVPWRVTAAQWNMLGSHDTPRLRSIVGSLDLVEVAVTLLMTYPGTPVVFAGDEVGLTGINGEHARATMPWDFPDRWDAATFDVYRSLVGVRRDAPALRRGGMRWVHVDDDALVYLRETPDERVLVAVARAPWPGVRLHPAVVGGALEAERLHGGLDLSVHDGAWALGGDGPAVGVWRLA
ncbi:glycoside hydrolase family 13 protein [Cellulosimicrobium cellulans]|uniref:glycoside hydrolase family 13 protein n=1 Tax=Cellulosimicrobium cellulans TaxID=1710 RepID=UPI0008486DE5|nr:glycoside hydrolase family 13 protein [Cellulosimicrobium cellulans]